MNYQIDDIIKFNNGEYLILDVIKKDENIYLYLINNDEFVNDVAITKVKNENGIIEYGYLDDDREFNYVLNKIIVDSKEDLLEFAIEE